MGRLKPGATYIYESPDGGHTIYAREQGSNDRILVGYDAQAEEMAQHKMWNDIWFKSRTNPALRKAVERAIIIYQTIKDDDGKNNNQR